jgi:hypothetical protein
MELFEETVRRNNFHHGHQGEVSPKENKSRSLSKQETDGITEASDELFATHICAAPSVAK